MVMGDNSLIPLKVVKNWFSCLQLEGRSGSEVLECAHLGHG